MAMDIGFAKEKLAEIKKGVRHNGFEYTYLDWMIDRRYDRDQILLRLGMLPESKISQVPWRRRPRKHA